MIKLPDELQALVHLANQLKGEKWTYSRTTPFSRGYITGNDGRTIVQTYDGEVPANVCRYFELADPATILSIADKIHRLNAAAQPDDSSDGYVKAFYEIASILGISAQPNSPKYVFERVMKPMLQGLLDTAQPVRDGWVKCSERMPEAEGHYLVFANASTLDGYCDHNDIACYQQGKWSNEFNWLVTHWMPLPAAPGGQD